MKLSEIVKKYRSEHNMSMQDFADRAGVSKGFISQIENEYTPANQDRPMMPSFLSLQKLAGAMGKDVNDLVAELDSDTEISLSKEDIIPNTPPLTEHGKRLLAAYDSASPDTKKAVDRILKISDTANLSIEELKRQEIAKAAWLSEYGGGDSAIRRGKE